MILMSSLSEQWNGVLPSGFTLSHFRQAFGGASWDALVASLAIGFSASLFALLCGTWAALALRHHQARPAPAEHAVLHSQRGAFGVDRSRGAGGVQPGPLQMNGTFLIVPVAHFVLISAFTFGNVMAGLARLPGDYENVAASLGASPLFRLRHVTLPMIAPI